MTVKAMDDVTRITPTLVAEMPGPGLKIDVVTITLRKPYPNSTTRSLFRGLVR